MREARIDCRRQHYANERKPVGISNDSALFFLGWTMLNQRTNRHHEKSAAESKRHQQPEYLRKGQFRQRQQAAENRHSDSAQRNQPILDFSARQIARRKTAYSDSDRQRRLQIASSRFIQKHDFAAVENNHKLQQRAQKPKISIADNRQLQRAIRTHQAPLRP